MSNAVSGFFDKLLSRTRAKSLAAVESWEATVKAVADGKGDADKVAEALERLSRSPEQLQVAVSLVLNRREWAKQLASLPALESELRRIGTERAATLAAHEKAVKELEQKADAILGPLADREAEIQRLKVEAGNAQGNLLRTSPHKQLSDKAADLRARAQQKREEAARHVELPLYVQAVPGETQAESMWGEMSTGHQADAHRAAMAARRRQSEQQRSDTVSRIRSEADELDRQAAEVDRGHLVP